MTFRSLYRLEPRGLLRLPDPRRGGRRLDRRRPARARPRVDRGLRQTIDEEAFDRFAARLSYVPGDFADAATSSAWPGARRARSPVFYLEIPPSLFGMVDQGPGRRRADRERARRRGEAVRARPRVGTRAQRASSTSTSTRRSSTGSTTSSGRWAWPRSSTCGSRTRSSSRSGTATTSPACRSRWPRTSASTTAATSTTRSARCATWSSTT